MDLVIANGEWTVRVLRILSKKGIMQNVMEIWYFFSKAMRNLMISV